MSLSPVDLRARVQRPAIRGLPQVQKLLESEAAVALCTEIKYDNAAEAFYVAAHEVVGSTANSAVRDNASAAEERSGDAAKWQNQPEPVLVDRRAPEQTASRRLDR